MSRSVPWLLLLYALPTKQATARIGLWRRLKRFGAVQLKTSAYVLPDEPVHAERFQWLAKQVRDSGGDATLIRVTEIEGMTAAEMIGLFNDARASEYKELMKTLGPFLARRAKRRKANHRDAERRDKSFVAALEKFRRRFSRIREMDYFGCPVAHDAQMLLRRAEDLMMSNARTMPRLSRERYSGRVWLTRPRPEIDRVGSAWLIGKFIDPRARFVFGTKAAAHAKSIPFDMSEGEFTHQGDDCTFETLLKRFGIGDRTAEQIGEMIHDADLEDGKFERGEGLGIDRVLKGWGRLGVSDHEILSRGSQCFDALYAELRRG